MQSRGCIDFTEITLSALRALGDQESPTDLALYLDHQIQHLLIDEFQDTSVVQFTLFEKLISTWDQDTDHSVFLVGDPMQSIYRFRNAEVGLFLKAKNQGIGPIELEFLELTTNFRSKSSIVKWFNQTFEHVFPPEEDASIGAIPYSQAHSANSDHDGKICYYAEPLDTTQPHQEIIETIQKTPVSDTVAILVRSRSQLSTILPALHRAGIPFNAIDIEPLTETIEIQDCLSLTLALLHRSDDIAWLSLLRTPFCGLNLKQIHDLKKLKKINYCDAIESALEGEISAAYRHRLEHINQAIKSTYNQWGQQPSSLLIHKCWQELNGPLCLQSRK